jgi:hypothetical protein
MILLWTVVLGIAGFVSGFIGPMVLAPEANQGPMLGLFIAGPGGALLGAALGGGVTMLGLPQRSSASLLIGCVLSGRRHALLLHPASSTVRF